MGWTNWEEINTGKGKNFGWPLYEGGNGVSLKTTALAEAPEFQELYATEPKVTAPIYSISHDDGGRSITLGDFYTGITYPDIYQGALFFADFNGDSGVDALTFDAEGNINSALNFTEEKFVTQISMGPDSHLYFSNLVTGEIGRWVYSPPSPNVPTNDDDFIPGSDDDDIIRGLDGNDVINGGQGNDKLIGNNGDDTISGDEGLDSLNGGSGNDLLFGNDGNDHLFGLADNDTLIGGSGDDILLGYLGRDLLEGGTGKDRLLGENDQDTLRGGDDDDYLLGGQGDDLLEGGTGNDTLDGGIGDDTLIAGQGDEILIGDDGADLFIIESIEGRNFIRDFEVAVDLLRVPSNVSLDNLNITNNWNNTGTLIFDNHLGLPIMVLDGITPDSLDINRDFV